jgi:hypothetical protein
MFGKTLSGWEIELRRTHPPVWLRVVRGTRDVLLGIVAMIVGGGLFVYIAYALANAVQFRLL